MTDQQIQAELTAAAEARAVVTLAQETFLRSLRRHANTLDDNGSTEVQQIVRDVNGALNAAADRLAYITEGAGQ